MAAETAAPRLTARPWWPAAKRTLTFAFFAAVLWLVVDHARTVDWSSVLRALRAYPAATLLTAAAFAAGSYAVYCTYDLIGRHETGHALRTMQVVGVGFVCYAFNLNLGSLVGGFAMRYRLYARLGLTTDVVTRVLGLSLLTNWLGYLVLGGLAFLVTPVELPANWLVYGHALRAIGVVMLVLAAVYLGMCFRAKRRQWHVRGHEIHLSSGRVALLQLVLSSANWMLIASVVWVLLQGRVDYVSTLSVLLVAAIAGVVTHVPAGLGVLEAVFVALLSGRAAQGDILAALLAYRAIYYLAPLAVALLLFALMDAQGRRHTAGLRPVVDRPASRPA